MTNIGLDAIAPLDDFNITLKLSELYETITFEETSDDINL